MAYNIKMSIKRIGPQEAEAIIGGHENYRDISAERARAYADLMSRGKWGLSVLAFDEEGILIDGQTRLDAVVKSGTDQYFVCLSNWPRAEVALIDNGKPRTRSQVAIAERSITNANKVMALVCSIESPWAGGVILNVDAIELLDKYRELAENLLSRTGRNSTMRAAVHLLAFARGILANPNKKNEIIDCLEKMVDLNFAEDRMHGLKLYYQWAVVKGFATGGKNARREAYLRCAKAIKSYIDNQRIDRLCTPSEDPFPYTP